MTTATSPRYRSVSAISAEAGATKHTVHSWIRAGELVAIDMARPGSRIPRYRIHEDAWQEFLAKRRSTPAAKPVRRPRQPTTKDYFPDL